MNTLPVREILLIAADLAASQPTTCKAISAGVGYLAAVPASHPALWAWDEDERRGGDTAPLGAILASRYLTPGEVAESLRRVAATPQVRRAA